LVLHYLLLMIVVMCEFQVCVTLCYREIGSEECFLELMYYYVRRDVKLLFPNQSALTIAQFSSCDYHVVRVKMIHKKTGLE